MYFFFSNSLLIGRNYCTFNLNIYICTTHSSISVSLSYPQSSILNPQFPSIILIYRHPPQSSVEGPRSRSQNVLVRIQIENYHLRERSIEGDLCRLLAISAAALRHHATPHSTNNPMYDQSGYSQVIVPKRKFYIF